MDDSKSQNFSVPHNVLEPLFISSGFSNLNRALDSLIEIAKASDGRLNLGSKRVLVPLLELCKSPSQLSDPDLLLTVKLVRNLCAGEIRNQDLFIEHNGTGIFSDIISVMGLASGCDNALLHMLLQALGNVALAGEQHQIAVWREFFPLGFLDIARVQNRDICDPLCMVIYTCSEGSSERSAELSTDLGLDILIEIIRMVTVAGFREDWLKLLLSRICIEECKIWSVFSNLSPVVEPAAVHDSVSRTSCFGPEQAFLLSIISEILNERIGEIVVSTEFSMCIFGLFKTAVENVDFTLRGNSALPTGSTDTNVMGYALSIIRDISACDSPKILSTDEKEDAVDMLVSAGLIKFLITLLRDLEPPALIRKAMNYSDANDVKTSNSSMYCPYRGFRRDVVAIIGNGCYRRKHVQDEIREQDGILLMLQQCVTDEDNPFLREWGIWSMRNILEGNAENKQLVADLEVQGSVNTPEITELGLRVEVDPNTSRPKLVNVS